MGNFELKAIHADTIPHAIEKAERYRLLNDPEQAESICRDVLAVDPNHQAAVRAMILTLTDQFASEPGGVREAKELIKRLTDPYDRAYFSGIVAERDARADLKRHGAQTSAYFTFREAMTSYALAETLRPAGNDDAILRWNSCVRTLEREKLAPEIAVRERLE